MVAVTLSKCVGFRFENRFGTVGIMAFATAIDPRSDRSFDVFYGMADYAIGCGRLAL